MDVSNDDADVKRYRGGSKVSLRHHLIDGLRAYLEATLCPLECVVSVLPAKIVPGVSGGSLRVVVTRPTPTGLKCKATSHGRMQEFFVVTSDATVVRAAILGR